MNTVNDYHERAMARADMALEARRRGDEDRARAYFCEALDDERRAAEMVAPDKSAEPTRSVLHRSAASLAAQCGQFREAERLIAVALSGDPPDEIAEELRDLIQQVHRELRKAPAAAAS
jgi:tetratricopeptide (TPR) repeat protein